MERESKQQIVDLVNRYLRDRHPEGLDLLALTDGVRREAEWWYIPVKPSAIPQRSFPYYEALADVEEELEQKEKLDVVLVPTYNDD